MPSCLIVGGGISGITAARTLIENGYDDIKILEASDRLGGRILTININKGKFGRTC